MPRAAVWMLRVRAAEMLADGVAPEEVAKRRRVSVRSVHRWKEDQVWTGPRVAKLIERTFHLSYSRGGRGRGLR